MLATFWETASPCSVCGEGWSAPPAPPCLGLTYLGTICLVPTLDRTELGQRFTPPGVSPRGSLGAGGGAWVGGWRGTVLAVSGGLPRGGHWWVSLVACS